MLFKFIVAISILFPLAGVGLMENGAWGNSVNKYGHPNGATWAFLVYCGVAFFTMLSASKLRLFHNLGKGRPEPLRNPARINFLSVLLMLSMLGFLLFGLGGIENYYGATNNAGVFRASLAGLSGLFGGVIIKYIAPSMFAFALMTNIAWDPQRVRSAVVFGLA